MENAKCVWLLIGYGTGITLIAANAEQIVQRLQEFGYTGYRPRRWGGHGAGYDIESHNYFGRRCACARPLPSTYEHAEVQPWLLAASGCPALERSGRGGARGGSTIEVEASNVARYTLLAEENPGPLGPVTVYTNGSLYKGCLAAT